MLYVNNTAPKDSTVAVWGPLAAAADFARQDLIVASDDGAGKPDYVLGCKRALDDKQFYPGYVTTFEVTRELGSPRGCEAKTGSLDAGAAAA